jgi:truncated hemoglobin YjbI
MAKVSRGFRRLHARRLVATSRSQARAPLSRGALRPQFHVHFDGVILPTAIFVNFRQLDVSNQMNKRSVIAAGAAVVMGIALSACSSMGSMPSATSAFEQFGGMKNITSMATDMVGTSLKDPRLSSLFAGKNIDSAAASSKLSDQLCATLGGGCKAPLTDAQISAAADKLNPDQKQALADNFNSSLNRTTSDPKTRDVVTKSIGSKLSGIFGGLL